MLEYKPRAYQQTGFDYIVNHTHAGLFLDMGLGKTVTTLTAINFLKYRQLDIMSVLIIAPKRVAEVVWDDEIAKWSHLSHLTISKVLGSEKKRILALNTKADIYIINRENVEWLVQYFGGFKLPFDMLVIDELSSFKSHKSKRFQALRQVRNSFSRIVGLTGTPASNGLIDLWAQLYLLDGGERLFKNITRYRETFFKPGKQNGNITYNYVLTEGSENRIMEKISDICISMKTKDYLELPDCIQNIIKIKLSDPVLKKYRDFERDNILAFIDSGVELTAVHAAALNNKLLQFSNGAVYYETQVDEYSKPKREYIEVHDEKLKELVELVDNLNGNPILIAYQFQHDKDRILKALHKYGVRELKTDKDIRDWNAGLIPALITHPASAGHGLNLQFGGYNAAWYGETYNLELYQQFNKRLDRSGQKHPVVIHHFICEGTMDVTVMRSREHKEKVQDFVMDELAAKIKHYKELYR